MEGGVVDQGHGGLGDQSDLRDIERLSYVDSLGEEECQCVSVEIKHVPLKLWGDLVLCVHPDLEGVNTILTSNHGLVILIQNGFLVQNQPSGVPVPSYQLGLHCI